MANLRIVYDNAVKRAALTASTEAGNLLVTNLKNDRKQQVWRATTTSATLTATFEDLELLSCVALPFCNLTSTATMRVRGYTNSGDVVPVFDTGTQLSCAYTPFDLWDWGEQPLGVNAFSYGGAAYAVLWFELASARKIVVDIVDVNNGSGYVESSHFVAGAYWSPQLNADYGASISIIERSKHERNASGDLRTDRGTRSRKVTMDLKMMPPNDRSHMWKLLSGNGMVTSMFLSLLPEAIDDPIGEQMYQIYGRLSQQSKIVMQSFQSYNAPIEIEEV